MDFKRSSLVSNGSDNSRVSERSRWPPLTRMLMSGEMSGEKPKELSYREQFDRWMVNEGYRRLCVGSKSRRAVANMYQLCICVCSHPCNGFCLWIYELPVEGQLVDSKRDVRTHIRHSKSFCPGTTLRRRNDSVSRLQNTHFHHETDTTQWHRTI